MAQTVSPEFVQPLPLPGTDRNWFPDFSDVRGGDEIDLHHPDGSRQVVMFTEHGQTHEDPLSLLVLEGVDADPRPLRDFTDRGFKLGYTTKY